MVCSEAVRSAILATAWFLVHIYSETGVSTTVLAK